MRCSECVRTGRARSRAPDGMRQASILPRTSHAPAGLAKCVPSWRRQIRCGNPTRQHRIRFGLELIITCGWDEANALHRRQRRDAPAPQRADSAAGLGARTTAAIAGRGIRGLRHLKRHARRGSAHQSGRQADPQAEQQRDDAVQFPVHDAAQYTLTRPPKQSKMCYRANRSGCGAKPAIGT